MLLGIGSGHLEIELGWGVPEDIYRREENRELHQDLLSPLRIGTESEERSQQVVFFRACDEAGGLDIEEKGESEAHSPSSLAHLLLCRLGRFVPRESLLESWLG